jgi:acyl-CoA thioester hydrolase
MINHKIEIRVRYGETDQMGFCYYGNYAQYLEVARVETLREQGISYKELEETGVLLPVRSYSIKFVSPAKYDDVLIIYSEITKLEGSRIAFSYLIHKNEQLIASAETELVFVSSDTFKPIKIPNSFEALINNLS